MDYNRLIILLAVLEKRLGVPLGSQDVTNSFYDVSVEPVVDGFV